MLRFLSAVRNSLIFGGVALCFFAANLGLIPDGRLESKVDEAPQLRRPAMIIHEAQLARPPVSPRKKAQNSETRAQPQYLTK